MSSDCLIDVKNFRGAGESKTISRTVHLDDDVATPVARVEADRDLNLDVLCESVREGILVTGQLTYPVDAECSRCLTKLATSQTSDVAEMFYYEAPEGEDDFVVVSEGFIDLTPTIRDAIVLDLPLAPVCDEACEGLCPECGMRLEDEPGHHHQRTDPRWAALGGLSFDGDNDPDSHPTSA